jgi:hypothetical protein
MVTSSRTFKHEDKDFDYSSDGSNHEDIEYDPFEYPSDTDSDEYSEYSSSSLNVGSGTI